jgi:GNAT superfamily N-acetyltransferase
LTGRDLHGTPSGVTHTEMLTLMDLNMREMYREDARATPGGRIVERGGLLMVGSPLGTVTTNMAIVTGDTDAATVRRETDRVFRAPGLPFSVWTRAHADAALEAALPAAGFTHIADAPGMALLPGDDTPEPTPPDVAIRPVTDDAGRAAYAHMSAPAWAIYGSPDESTRAHFSALAGVHGPTTQAFLAYRGARAVAGAILYVSHDVGGVGWVGTHPDEQRRGYGAAVTWAVVHEGFRRGVRLMNLQASPMGEPVYRRMGFRTPTQYRFFVAGD